MMIDSLPWYDILNHKLQIPNLLLFLKKEHCSVLVIDYWNLIFICNLKLVIWDLLSLTAKDLKCMVYIGWSWSGEYMPNPHLEIHPIFIPMTSRVIIWDFRLRISDFKVRLSPNWKPAGQL
jgi:hypothetical protein